MNAPITRDTFSVTVTEGRKGYERTNTLAKTPACVHLDKLVPEIFGVWFITDTSLEGGVRDVGRGYRLIRLADSSSCRWLGTTEAKARAMLEEIREELTVATLPEDEIRKLLTQILVVMRRGEGDPLADIRRVLKGHLNG